MAQVRSTDPFLGIRKLIPSSHRSSHWRLRDGISWLALGQLDCTHSRRCCYGPYVGHQRDLLSCSASEESQGEKEENRRGKVLVPVRSTTQLHRVDESQLKQAIHHGSQRAYLHLLEPLHRNHLRQATHSLHPHPHPHLLTTSQVSSTSASSPTP
jgi:hypothetical protein